MGNTNIYDDMRTIIKYININCYINIDGVVSTIKLFESFINDFDIFINSFHTELTFIIDFDNIELKNVKYYGSKMIICNYIETFNFFSNNGVEKVEGLHLKITQPTHIFDTYIKAHYTGIIDMYPSKIITIKKIEIFIINNLVNHCKHNELKKSKKHDDISIDQYDRLIDIYNSYKLIGLCITLNNYRIKQLL